MRVRDFVCTVLVGLSVLLSSVNPALAWERGQGRAAAAAAQGGAAGAALSEAVNMDLSSTTRSLSASALGLANTVTINVGGAARSVGAADVLTPAELMAVAQVMNGGIQSLKLGADGNAVRGRFSLSEGMAAQLTGLVIPVGVKLVQDFGTLVSLSFTGDLVNSGRIVAFSSSAAQTNAAFNAQNIFNQASGVITSMPEGSMGRNSVANLGMTLSAVDNLVNEGRIISAGDLNLYAGGTITNVGQAGAPPALMQATGNMNVWSANVVNSGVMSSLNGNANFNTVTAVDMNINNLGGQILAANGAINLRDASYVGTANTNITGGDLVSQTLNLSAGNGVTSVDVDQLTGVANSSGYGAHVMASTNNLQLGNFDLIDPTFYNDAGDITINGTVSAQEAIAIIASGDIIAGSNGKIVAKDATSGKDITIIAGAIITPCAACIGTIELPNGGNAVPLNETIMVDVLGSPVFIGIGDEPASPHYSTAPGGRVDLSGSSQSLLIDASAPNGSGSGGNITIVAVGGIHKIGTVKLPTSGAINASGGASGSGGKVLIVANTNAGVGITSGPIVSNGNGASIMLVTAVATTDNGLPLQFRSDGSTVGNHYITFNPLAVDSASISLTGSVTATTAVSVIAGENIVQSGGRLNGLHVTLKALNGDIGVSSTSPLNFASDVITAGKVDLIAQAGGSVWLKDPLAGDKVRFDNRLAANVSRASTSFSLIAMDNIVSATTDLHVFGPSGDLVSVETELAVASPVIRMTSINGDVGTNSGAALEIASNISVPGTLNIAAYAGGTVALYNRLENDHVIVEDSFAGLSFGMNVRSGILVHDVYAETGRIELDTYSGTLEVTPGSHLIAGHYGITLLNLDTDNGNIIIGKDVEIASHRNVANSYPTEIIISIYFAHHSSTESGPDISNITSVASNGGMILLGQNGIFADLPINRITADGGNIIFDTNDLTSNHISLNGGVKVKITTLPFPEIPSDFPPEPPPVNNGLLSSLDLTDPIVVSSILTGQLTDGLGGELIVSGGVVTGGNLIVQPEDLAGFLTAMNIPRGVTVEFSGFDNATTGALNVDLASASSTSQVVIHGTGTFTNSPDAVLNISSDSSKSLLVIGNTGLLSADGNLSITGTNGDMLIGGNITNSSLSNVITIQTGGAKGNVSLNGNIGSQTTNFEFDLAGELTQKGGVLIANSLTIQTGGNVGTQGSPLKTAASLISVNSNGAKSLVNVRNRGEVTLNSSSSTRSFNFANEGQLTVGNVSTTAGSISLKTTIGALNVMEDATLNAVGGSLTLLNASPIEPMILVGAGANLAASAKSAAGVYLLIGGMPLSPRKGTTPANVQVNGSNVFFGARGITANTPVNVLTTVGQTILFNTGRSPASAIVLNGDVSTSATKISLTADDQHDNEAVVDTGEFENDGAELFETETALSSW